MSELRRRLLYAKSKELPNYLCFTALVDNSTIGKTGTYTSSLEFSVNGSTWNVFDNSTTINLNAGEKAYFRGTNTRLASSDSVCTTFVMTGSIAGSGNVMSLLYANDFDTRLSLTVGNEFRSLFINCTALTSAPELPATTVSGWSTYDRMFKGCTSLVAAPDLPASSLSRGCYTSMFEGCTGMLTAGTMSITSVAQDSLNSMFKGCSALIDASNIEINATSISTSSFLGMFYNCISLVSPPSLRIVGAYANTAFSQMFYNCGIKSFPSFHMTNIGASELQYMFYGCSSMEGDIDLSSCTSAYGTYQCREMFRNCSKITKAVLPSITEVPASAYQDMFNGCSMLSYVMILSISVASNWSLSGWLNNVASNGILVKHIDATWTGNVPSNWTVIYYDPALDKYYTDQTKATECDDHGNPI